MMKYLQLLLSFCFILGALMFAIPSIGYACSCIVPPPPDQALQQANAVFAGKVISIKENNDKYEKTVLFEVTTTWKGIDQKQIEITTPLNSAACGYEFKEGQQYLVYANQEESNQFETNLCTRTAELSSAKEDLSVLGEGEMPTTEMKNEGVAKPVSIYAWISGVVIIGIAAFFVWRRFRG
jgi:hypothetical protein